MTTVRAIATFSPNNSYEDIPEIISLSEGEILTDVLLLEGGWWYGKKSSGEKGYFPCTYITTVEYCESSVIENIETCNRDGLILITIDLPQPPTKKMTLTTTTTTPGSTPKSTPASTSIPTTQNAITNENILDVKPDKRVITDLTGWLTLKDDQSGKNFYFKNGEYAWNEGVNELK